MHIPSLFCINCAHEMLPVHTGAKLDVHASFGSYYKIHSDAYECPLCNARVAFVASSTQPRGEHFMEGYDDIPTDYTVKLNN
jgi:hypothetical protein